MNENYHILWFILNSILFLYGIIIFIYVKCFNKKRTNSSNVILYNIYSFKFLLIQNQEFISGKIVSGGSEGFIRDTKIISTSNFDEDINENLIVG